MGYKTISSGNSSWTGTSSADNVYINSSDKVRVNTAGDNDSIYNYFGWYETIDAGDGNDTIKSYRGKGSSLVGGAGADLISLSGDSANITVKGGTGNDVIVGDSAAQLFQYASGDGNDFIYNWSTNDTISITGGTYTRSTVGNDVVLKVGYGTVSLIGAKGKTVNIKGTLAGGSSTPVTSGGVKLNNTASNKTIYGTSYADTIENNGDYVTIVAGDGNDRINNMAGGKKNKCSISTGAGKDTIDNMRENTTIDMGAGDDFMWNEYATRSLVFLGAGNDSIISYSEKATISGDDGNDTIVSYYGKNTSINGGAGADVVSLGANSSSVTVKAGTGNDSIYGDSSNQLFQYAAGDGNDVIYNWSANDTISITGGSYTRSTVGNDVVLQVGNGAITVKGAKNTTVNVKGTLASGGGGSTIPAPQPSGNAIYGTNGHDNIKTSVAGAVIYAYGGNDTVYNNRYNNVTIYGGDGADSIYAQYSENVAISGGAGNDKVTVYSGNNASVVGDAGNDTLKVLYGTGALISGGDGADYLENGGNNALIYGGNGNDYLRSNSGNNVSIYGGSGNDYIQATGNYNPNRNGFFSGGDGSDTIVTQVGNGLSISGGAGNDLIQLQSSRAACVIAYNSGDGNDTVTGFDGNDTLKVYGSYTRSTVGNDVVVKVGYGSITLKNAKNSTLNISNLASSADLVSSADLASDDWISADDTNFVTGDAQIDSIVKPITDYSVGDFNSIYNPTSLTRNNIITFTKK